MRLAAALQIRDAEAFLIWSAQHGQCTPQNIVAN